MPHLINQRYELLEVIASGGMATVWRARDVLLGRIVALKRPHPVAADDPRLDRIIKEGEAAAALSHPGLVTVFDVGTDDEGAYLVMELVDAPTLDEIAPTLGTNQLVDVVGAVSEALAVVHSAGIVHGDIKPANVLMSDRGPILSDFGVATVVDSTEALDPNRVVMGTPTYAAPEAMAGGPVTPKSDVFSLAVMGRQLLSASSNASVPPHVSELLEEASAVDPNVRPDVVSFGRRLRAEAPTIALDQGGSRGDTVPLVVGDPEPHPIVGQAAAPAAGLAGRTWMVGAGVALGLLVLAAPWLDRGETSPVASTALETVVPSSTVPDSSTPDSTAPATSLAPSTTVAPATVESARDDLLAIIGSVPPPDLKPKDARDLEEKIDKAIEEAERGDFEKASKSLSDTAEGIDKKLNDPARSDALDALATLAERLNVPLPYVAQDDDNEEDD